MAKQPTKNTNTSLALYEDFDLDALQQDREDSKKSSKSKNLGALPQGKTVLRMGPPRPGTKTPWRPVWMHYVDVPGLDNSVAFVCPRMEAKLPCRVCTKAKQMQASNNPVDQKRGENLLPQRQLFANVFQRAAPEEGWKVWKFGTMIHKKLIEIRDPDEGLGLNFTHPVNGYDLIIIRTGEKKNTRYSVAVDPKGPSPLLPDNAEMTELLQQMHNLESLAAVPSDHDIQEMLAGRRPQPKPQTGGGEYDVGEGAAGKVYDSTADVDDDDL
jgi:hypothetical protein